MVAAYAWRMGYGFVVLMRKTGVELENRALLFRQGAAQNRQPSGGELGANLAMVCYHLFCWQFIPAKTVLEC